MKKLTCILLVVFSVVLLSISVFAETNEYLYNGVKAPDITVLPDYNEYTYHIIRVTSSATYTYFLKNKVSFNTNGPTTGSGYHSYKLVDGVWVDENKSSGSASLGSASSLKWSDYRILNGSTVVLEASEPVLAVCTGETCPATDMNMDNVCDDCALPFAVRREYTLPDVYVVWTESRQESYPYAFIYYDNDAPWLILSAEEPYHDNVDVVVPSNYAAYSVFGENWRLSSSYEDGRTFVTDVVIPSFNLRNMHNEIVFERDLETFPTPLWMAVQEVTKGEIPSLQTMMVGTIQILLLCGVGLIASLVVLNLFGKVLKTYRH